MPGRSTSTSATRCSSRRSARSSSRATRSSTSAGPRSTACCSSVLHTRTIVNPLAGVKVSGQAGEGRYAGCAVRDRRSAERIAGVPDAQVSVVRYKRSLNQDSYLGGFYVGREQGEAFNRVAGADGTIRFSQSTAVGIPRVRLVHGALAPTDEGRPRGRRRPDDGHPPGHVLLRRAATCRRDSRRRQRVPDAQRRVPGDRLAASTSSTPRRRPCGASQSRADEPADAGTRSPGSGRRTTRRAPASSLPAPRRHGWLPPLDRDLRRRGVRHVRVHAISASSQFRKELRAAGRRSTTATPSTTRRTRSAAGPPPRR